MMKIEFDKLVGITIDPAHYEKIEYVYMNSEQFSNSNGKQEIADFYKKHDMNGIETLYKELIVLDTAEFKTYIENLSYFAEVYVTGIKEHLIKNAVANYQNKTIVKLLEEYRSRKLKEEKEHFRNFLCSLKYGTISLSNDCLTNSRHYRTVLYDLLIG